MSITARTVLLPLGELAANAHYNMTIPAVASSGGAPKISERLGHSYSARYVWKLCKATGTVLLFIATSLSSSIVTTFCYLFQLEGDP